MTDNETPVDMPINKAEDTSVPVTNELEKKSENPNGDNSPCGEEHSNDLPGFLKMMMLRTMLGGGSPFIPSRDEDEKKEEDNLCVDCGEEHSDEEHSDEEHSDEESDRDHPKWKAFLKLAEAHADLSRAFRELVVYELDDDEDDDDDKDEDKDEDDDSSDDDSSDDDE